jgi:hypothetical protein
VFLEGVDSKSPHGSAMCDKHSQIVLICDRDELICEDTYPRRDKWDTYLRRDKWVWAYIPTSLVEST